MNRQPDVDPRLVELLKEEEWYQRKSRRRPRVDSIERQVTESPQIGDPTIRSRRPRSKSPFPPPRYIGSLAHHPDIDEIDHANWTDPDHLISLLQSLHSGSTPWVEVRDAQATLENYKLRLGLDPYRFRHPSCRPVHSLFTLGGFHNAHRMSLCMAGKGGPCGIRRYCAFCGWLDGQKRVKKFVHPKLQLVGVTFSWKFGTPEPGLPFTEDAWSDTVCLWNLIRDCLRALGESRSPHSNGVLAVEQLAVTRFKPCLVVPHSHGVVAAPKGALDDFKRTFENCASICDSFKAVARRYPGLRPDVQFDTLEDDVDQARWISYCFAPFGLGRKGFTLDCWYQEAFGRCPDDAGRRLLNLEVANLIDGFVAVTTDTSALNLRLDPEHALASNGRRRVIFTGCFHAQCKRFKGKNAKTKRRRLYLKSLSSRIREAEESEREAKSRCRWSKEESLTSRMTDPRLAFGEYRGTGVVKAP